MHILELSVIIVNYNVKYFTEQCLYSVEKACTNLQAEIIVVDNASTDNSKDFLSTQFAHVQFIWNKENLGFSRACNIGLLQAKGQMILFLNPDTIIPEDCFDKSLSFYRSQKDIGALGIRMIDGKGMFLKESKRGFPSLSTSFFKMAGLAAAFPRSKFFARYYLGNLPDNISQQVQVLSGAYMMADKKLLDSLSGFDEDFFMYGEDIDLSYRIQKAGYKNYYFAGCTILHFKGESTQKKSLRYVELFYGAMELFVYKHYGKGIARIYSLLIQFIKKIKKSAILPGGKKINETIEQKQVNTLVIGDPEHSNTLVNALKNAGTNLQVMGVITPHHDADSEAFGNLEQLPQLIQKHSIERLLFCINDYASKQAIDLLQKQAPNVQYLFHYIGSNSVVEIV